MKEIKFRFRSPKDSPGYLLGQVTTLWHRQIKKVLDPLNLTQTQFVLLAALGWLSKSKDVVTQVDIANQGNADRMMVSKVLRTLQDKEFISREEHQTDTRAKVIKLTEQGALVLQRALLAVESADSEFFSVLGNRLSFYNADMVNLIEENKSE